MSKAARKKFKRDMADSIRNFGRSLKQGGVLLDDKPFTDAANQCISGPVPEVAGLGIDYSKCWGYNLVNVVIRIPAQKKPGGIYPANSTLDSIRIAAKVIGNYITDDTANDPFAHVEFNLVISGKNDRGEEMLACWHFDRHLGGISDEVHPDYHFQYGGKNLKLPGDNYGSHLVLETPRLMHLPLDAVLGLDVVLGNFLGAKRKILCMEPQYRNSVLNLQKTFWRPYAYALANKWATYASSGKIEWNSSAICPHLV